MRGGLRLQARRACLAAAGACALFAAVAPSSPAQEADLGPRPEVFRGSATSQVISVQVDRKALLPVPDLFRFIVLDGQGTYESSFREARSSLFFPGNGLILGPSLACGTFAGSLPPEFSSFDPILKPLLAACLQYKYPLTVFADDFQPDGATSGSLALGASNDPISGNAIRAKAHAGEDKTTTDAVMQDLRVLGVPPFGPVTPQLPGFEMDTSLLKVDSAVSRTDQRIEDGVLVVESEATLSGISMIGGLIRIENLRSFSKVTDDARGKRTAVPSLTMSGITVGGQPAKLTDQGFVLGTSASGPLDQQLQSGLNEILRAFNIRVTTLDSEKDLTRDGAAVAGVGGLLIEFERDVQGLPSTPRFPDPRFPNTEADPNGLYTGSIQLGTTGALGAAFDFDDDFTGDIDPDLPDLPDVGFDSGSADFDGGSFEGALPPASPDAGPGVVSEPRSRPNTNDGVLTRSLGDRFGDRMGLMYLSLMFAVLGCCIAPSFSMPARFGGRHT
ncbi:MAG: choice-of-anchor P family protein [Actinomycetota bacterium]